MAELNPDAGVGAKGDGFLIYTTEEGGPYHVCRATQEEYASIIETGRVNVRVFDDIEQVISDPVYFAYLAVVESNYDTILGDAR